MLIYLTLNSKSTISFLFQFEFMQHDDSFVWGEVGEGQAWYILSRLSLQCGGRPSSALDFGRIASSNGGGGVIYIYIPRYLWHPIVNNRLWWNFWMSQYFEPWCWRMTSASDSGKIAPWHQCAKPLFGLPLYQRWFYIADSFKCCSVSGHQGTCQNWSWLDLKLSHVLFIKIYSESDIAAGHIVGRVSDARRRRINGIEIILLILGNLNDCSVENIFHSTITSFLG